MKVDGVMIFTPLSQFQCKPYKLCMCVLVCRLCVCLCVCVCVGKLGLYNLCVCFGEEGM